MRILLAEEASRAKGPHSGEAWALALQAAGQEVCLLDFLELRELSLNELREALRKRLDRELGSFQPDLLLSVGIGLWGQLLLETGAPYVVTMNSCEWRAAAADIRLQPLIEQAVENAGRIFVHDGELRHELTTRYGLEPERTVVLPEPATTADLVPQMLDIYARVLQDRQR